MNRATVILGLILILGGGPWLAAQDKIDTAFVLPRQHHAWGRFEVGAWKKVRVITETLNEQGEVIGTSSAETITRLINVDARGFNLQSETTISIGGRELGRQTTTIWQGFSGEQVDDQVSGRLVRPVSVKIGTSAIDTQEREYVFRCNNMRRVTTLFYSPSIEPHVLEGHTVATDASGRHEKFRTDIEVVSLNHDYQVLNETHKVAKVKTLHVTPKSQITTFELFSPKVPGGIAASESEEVDLSGKVVSRSTLELLEYGDASTDKQNRLFSGGRFFRNRKSR